MPAKKTDRKIFNQSYDSRLKLDLEFTYCCWWLRSADSTISYLVSYVDYYDLDVYPNVNYNTGAIPVCMI